MVDLRLFNYRNFINQQPKDSELSNQKAANENLLFLE